MDEGVEVSDLYADDSALFQSLKEEAGVESMDK